MSSAALQLFENGTADLPGFVLRHIKGEKISIAELAIRTGVSRSALSKYLSNKYDSNPAAIEEKLCGYFAEQGISPNKDMNTTPSTRKPAFFESGDAAGVMGVCSSCQEFAGLGVVVGRSGFGKTHTLKHFAQLPKTAYVECDDTMAGRDLVEAIERVLGIPHTYGTIWKQVNGIREFLNVNAGYLLIIDEADKLLGKYSQKKMEILRAIIDQSEVGMVIAGEPRLESLLKSYLPRFSNRVDFYYALKGLSKKELETYLGGFAIDDAARKKFYDRAANVRTGCFRLLDRTLNNVLRIVRESGQTTITTDVIMRASDMMML